MANWESDESCKFAALEVPVKLHTGDPWMPAPAYARSLTNLSVNLLVPDIASALPFHTEVLAEARVNMRGTILPEAPETCNNCPSWNTGPAAGIGI